MDRNAFVGMMLILLIWMLWQAGWQRKQTPPPDQKPIASSTATPLGSASSASLATGAPAAVAASVPEERRVLENQVLKLEVGARSGALRAIWLKNYKDNQGKDAQPVNLVDAHETSYPFALWLSAPDGKTTVLEDFQEVSYDAGDKKIVARLEKAGEWRIERTIHLQSEDSYNLMQEVRLTNLSSKVVEPQVAMTWNIWALEASQKRSFFSPPPNLWESLVLMPGNKLTKQKVKDGESADVSGEIAWAALGNRYFLTAVLPQPPELSRVQTVRQVKDGGTVLENRFWSRQLKVAPGESVDLNYKVFVGPKELKTLEAQGNNLVRALDLGVFEFFALGLLKLMQFFHRFLGNWGLSIIALTILVKMIFYPLSYKSFKSMKEMQRIQPLINDLKERYKDDKEQLNVQMLKIMREHKVNPLGGCLPMLVQLPIYFALYKVFYSSIELRHAPFFGWIHDLSSRDPYFITPALLGVSMFLQQKMSPKPPDPVQAQMMNIMPIMFTFFMIFLPSGLVLYILCNTLFTVAQQWYINKSLNLPAIPELAESKS